MQCFTKLFILCCHLLPVQDPAVRSREFPFLTRKIYPDCVWRLFSTSSSSAAWVQLRVGEVSHLHSRHSNVEATWAFFNTYTELTKEINTVIAVKEHSEAKQMLISLIHIFLGGKVTEKLNDKCWRRCPSLLSILHLVLAFLPIHSGLFSPLYFPNVK